MAGPPAPTSRARPPTTGDEEATGTLKLGDFSNADTLSVSEAFHIITKMEERLREAQKPVPNNDVYVKTREYLDLFARFKNFEAVQTVAEELDAFVVRNGLAPFEKAQIATLTPDSAEEARFLIPSLEGKVSDDELQQVLDNISKLRDFS